MQHASRGYSNIAEKVEDGLGFFFANLLTVATAGWIVYVLEGVDHRKSVAEWLVFNALAFLWLFLDAPYLARLWFVTFRGGRPIALTVASRQRMWPLLLRPIVGVWWLAHFLIGVAASLATHGIKTNLSDAGELIVFGFMSLCYGFAANGYLMMAVCAMTKREVIRQGVWRFRILLDITLGVLGAAMTL